VIIEIASKKTNDRGLPEFGISSGEISEPMIWDSVHNRRSKRGRDHSEKAEDISSETEKKKCNKEDWVIQEDSRRLKTKKIKVISKEIIKESNTKMKINHPTGESDMTTEEKEIYSFIANSKSVYENSVKESSTIYYNVDGKLKAINYEDKEMIDKYKKWEKDQFLKYDNKEPGIAVILINMKGHIQSHRKGINKSKIIFALHKFKCEPLGIEMVSRSTTRVLYENKYKANKCLETFSIHNKLFSASIDIHKREKICRGIINDWPNGIPELFEAMDEQTAVIKLERLKKKIYDKESKTLKTKETGDILVTFKNKTLHPNISIYNKMGFIRVRPYIGATKQCFNCFKFGHIKATCRSSAVCPICGEEATGSAIDQCVVLTVKNNINQHIRGVWYIKLIGTFGRLWQ